MPSRCGRRIWPAVGRRVCLRQFRDFAAELGLDLWGLNAVGADYFQPFDSQASYDRTLAGLKADVDYALELGVTDVMVWEGVSPAG